MHLRHSLPLLAVLAGCQAAAPPPPHPAAPAPPPRSANAPPANAPAITRVDLGNSLGSDQRVSIPMLRFAPSDTIYASLLLNGQPPAPHHIDARWSHLDSKQVVLAEGKTLVLTHNAITTFQISRPTGWPPGHYKLELLLDQVLVQTRLFEVSAPTPTL